MATSQPTHVPNVPTSSRASSLPQFLRLFAGDHRQVKPLLFRAINGDLVTGIGMAHDAGARVVVQHAGNPFGRFVGAVTDDHHARVLGEAHADAATVVQ